MSVVIPTEERALAVTGVMGEGRGRTARPGRSSAAPGSARSIGSSASAPPQVLIVDDHPPFRWIVRKLLEARGYAVAGEAQCAASALAAAARLAPDAVLLDVRLGDDSGHEVARALSGLDPAPAVLLVSVSEDGTGTDQEYARAAGARGFLLKNRLAVTDLARYWPPPEPTSP
jgi:CheY-like chemotaxis protein